MKNRLKKRRVLFGSWLGGTVYHGEEVIPKGAWDHNIPQSGSRAMNDAAQVLLFQPGILVHRIVQPRIAQWVFVYQLTQSWKALTNMLRGLFISMVILNEIQMIINIIITAEKKCGTKWRKITRKREQGKRFLLCSCGWVPGVSWGCQAWRQAPSWAAHRFQILNSILNNGFPYLWLFLRVIVNFGLWSQKENPYCWKGSPSGGCPLWEEAERANWIWARVHTFKAHLYWSISSSKDETLQSTITFPNRVTTWEPSPQIHEPMRNRSNLITTISKFSLYRKFLYWTKRKSIRYNLSKKS